MMSEKVEVENINTPGRVARVDKEKYDAMRQAYLKVLPKSAPGLSAKEAQSALIPMLPQDLFPDGAKSGWWMKTVQLDLEAKGIVKRENSKPLRFFLT
jgi:hypothetical protein